MLRSGKGTSGSTPPSEEMVTAAERIRRSEPRRVVLFDPRPLFAESLACWLRSVDSPCAVSTFQDIGELLNCAGSGDRIDLILFSVCESGFRQVLPALDRLTGMSTSIPSIVVTGETDPAAALEFLRRGARGVIPTALDLASAAAALDFVSAGGTFLPAMLFLDPDSGLAPAPAADVALLDPEEADAAGDDPGSDSDGSASSAMLTRREVDVLESLCRGKPNKLIAHELALGESTVKMYVGRLMRKLNATNRTEVALHGGKLLRGQGAPSRRRPAFIPLPRRIAAGERAPPGRDASAE
jgi:DNA-binding NarL/FixJ family response regulator